MPLRYAILRHEPAGGETHFDLMFETAPGSSLATWRSAVWPIDGPTEVTRIKDHRRIYLDYEGEIAGGRGYVTRVAGGGCEVEVGEANVWTMTLLTGAMPQRLTLRNAGHPEIWELTTQPVGGSNRSTGI